MKFSITPPSPPRHQNIAMENFMKRMNALQTEGVSSQEIMNYMRNTLLDQSTRANYDRLVETMDAQNLSSNEAGNIAMKFMAAKYKQGASYSGSGKASLKAIAVTRTHVYLLQQPHPVAAAQIHGLSSAASVEKVMESLKNSKRKMPSDIDSWPFLFG